VRQLFLEKGSLIVQEVAQPSLDERSVLISVHYSFVSSGTEAATISNAQRSVIFSNVPNKIKTVLQSISENGFSGTTALINSKLKGNLQALGYSCSGRVLAVGKKITKFRAGDFVACAGAGWANHADVVCVPENLVVLIRDEAFVKHASITTIGSIALQGIRRAELQLGETVCVMGLGLLGQITVQLAKNAGCKVIGVDLLPERMALALELGADRVFKADSESFEKDMSFLTEHRGVDCTIITAATPSSTIVQAAMEVTRRKGKVVVVGDVGLDLQRNPLYKKEIDLLISCSYGPGRYDPSYEIEGKDYPYDYVRWTENRNMEAIVDLISSKKLLVDKLATQEFFIEDVTKAYELIKNKEVLGVILRYTPKNDVSFVPAVRKPFSDKAVAFAPAAGSTLRVGFVGAGGFSKIKLLPIVSQVRDIKISAIVDTDVTNAKNVCRTYGAAVALTDARDLFEKDMVDAVVIASPHKFHCDQALEALSYGKAVFLEKPMATTFEQYARISKFLMDNPQVPFCVDFNRSFAPFIQKIKWELVSRKSPVVILYRMNAGYVSRDHWTQTELGAGRVIGEACHIFDLFCFLTGAKPVAVSVESLKPASEDLFPTDNFSAQISFDDGSICTLLYTALGHSGLGKERMEIFYDSKTILMDDYKVLQGFGLSHSFNESTRSPNKGHEVLLQKFFSGLQSEERKMPIPVERLTRVAELTLIIDELVCKGGGNKEFSQAE
jgi:predicted dehydrogenase/threonine dehydrogenase-like Zn-dependent dehydrogenase